MTYSGCGFWQLCWGLIIWYWGLNCESELRSSRSNTSLRVVWGNGHSMRLLSHLHDWNTPQTMRKLYPAALPGWFSCLTGNSQPQLFFPLLPPFPSARPAAAFPDPQQCRHVWELGCRGSLAFPAQMLNGNRFIRKTRAEEGSLVRDPTVALKRSPFRVL